MKKLISLFVTIGLVNGCAATQTQKQTGQTPSERHNLIDEETADSSREPTFYFGEASGDVRHSPAI
jgi:hypothetical protein